MRMSKSFRKWTALVVAAILLLLAWDWYTLYTAEDKFDHGPLSLLNKRPAHIYTERVNDWSLLIKGRKLADQHHELHIGEELHFTGHLHAALEKIPPASSKTLVVSVRPADEVRVDKEWPVGGKYFYLDWGCSSSNDGRDIDHKTTVREKVFSPGEYYGRIYFTVEDRDAGENTIDLLATCTFTLLAPEKVNE